MTTTPDVSLRLLNKFFAAATEAGWTPVEIDAVAEDPKQLSRFREVQLGLAYIRSSEQLILDCSKPLDIAKFFGAGVSIWRGPRDGDGMSGKLDIDPRADRLTTVDYGRVFFYSCLNKGFVDYEYKINRLKARKKEIIRHGGQQLLALWTDYQERHEKSVLDQLRRTREITYLDFPGLILRNKYGLRHVPYLSWNATANIWYMDLSDLLNGWSNYQYSPVSFVNSL